ncbi:hypothetical protein NL676_020944 [Syzygium grande]|nr:hypothetical protein NL676_020944 [Syzygium grande]
MRHPSGGRGGCIVGHQCGKSRMRHPCGGCNVAHQCGMRHLCGGRGGCIVGHQCGGCIVVHLESSFGNPP